MEPSLEQFPAWVQTVAYVGAAVVGLAVASHGYFKAWIKKIAPGKEQADGGKVVSSVMVMDRAAIQNLADALLRVDTTLRSIQDDLHRGHDRSDKARDQMEELIDLLRSVQNQGETETTRSRGRD